MINPAIPLKISYFLGKGREEIGHANNLIISLPCLSGTDRVHRFNSKTWIEYKAGSTGGPY
jgi:hypothetical protein